MTDTVDGVYRVLARKYRPQSFDDLIGQDAMVRTLRNAFDAQRIHQAYIFTGVRGVGKTTTARILARALNYETESVKIPQIEMPGLGVHCQAIMESRHVDVIEMDAASNTSVANIREIIEAARYKPVSARTKVYIIDEVHMLSNAAFNGLLKTLEEPPPHVKFLFATTEIRKVPVTVLSRCQRFDLRRIEIPAMIAYLDAIAGKENVTVEPEAMALIARASEGSMRDALSLMDQAISHGGGKVRAEEVRASLGLADRGRVIDLFDHVMRGKIAEAFSEFDNQHHEGADPAAILTDLADYVHIVTRLKLVPDAVRDTMLSESERERGLEFAKTIGIRALTMAWQILLKGLQEVNASARPKIAAEMVLVRLAYAADLPNPDDVIRDWKAGGMPAANPAGSPPPASPAPMPTSTISAPPMSVAPQRGGAPGIVASHAVPHPMAEVEIASPMPRNLQELVALAETHRDIRLKTALERDIRLVSIEAGRIELGLTPHAEADLPNRLAKALMDWTGQRWGISIARDDLDPKQVPTLHEEAASERQAALTGLRANPAVQAILLQFPGTEIVAIRAPSAHSITPIESDDEGADEPIAFTDDDL